MASPVARRRHHARSLPPCAFEAQAKALLSAVPTRPSSSKEPVPDDADLSTAPTSSNPSLDSDLTTRLAMIENKLNWMTYFLGTNFDKLNAEMSKTREAVMSPGTIEKKVSDASTLGLLVKPRPMPPGAMDKSVSERSELGGWASSNVMSNCTIMTSPCLPEEDDNHSEATATPSTRSPGHKGTSSSAVPGDERSSVDASMDSPRNKSASTAIADVVHSFTNGLVNLGSNSHPVTAFLWEILEDPESNTVARVYGRLEAILIMVSVLVSLVKTMDPPPIEVRTILTVQLFLDAFFLLELMLRYIICHSTRLYFSNPSNLIDMTAGALSFGLITPCLAGAWECTGDGPVAMTLIVIMPLLRLMKSLRHFHQFYIFLNFAYEISEALVVLILLLGMIVLLFASIVYIVEPRENIPTMPIAMYFIVTTISTVGYGDYSPETTIGYGVVSVVILVSILFMALPLGIIGNAFSQIWSQRDHVMLTRRIMDRLNQWGYTAKDMGTLVAYFDANSDGQLEMHEFVNMVDSMGVSIKHEKVVALFEAFDVDAREAVDARNLTRVLFPGQYHELYPTSTSTAAKPKSFALYRGASLESECGFGGFGGFTNIFRRRESVVHPVGDRPAVGSNYRSSSQLSVQASLSKGSKMDGDGDGAD